MRRIIAIPWRTLGLLAGTLATCLAGFALAVPAANAGGHIYWGNAGNFDGTTIGRANLDGSSVDNNFITEATTPLGLATDASHIYWTNTGNFVGTTIGRADLDGSNVNQSFIENIAVPTGVAVDDSYVYWANIATGKIGRANLDGSNVDPNFIPVGQQVVGIAVGSGHIYWTINNDTIIGRANLDGSNPEYSFITDANRPFGLAFDANHVYWTNTGDATIGRANLDGSSVDQNFSHDGGAGIALDASYIYVGTGPQGTIARLSIDGSNLDPNFITGANSPFGVALDGPAPTPPIPATAKPAITSFSVSPRKPRRAVNKLKFTFKLSEAATVKLVVQRKYGRTHHSKCLRTTSKTRGKKRCPIYRPVATRSIEGKAGQQTMTFNATALNPGAYRATLTATNPNGTPPAAYVVFYRPWW